MSAKTTQQSIETIRFLGSVSKHPLDRAVATKLLLLDIPCLGWFYRHFGLLVKWDPVGWIILHGLSLTGQYNDLYCKILYTICQPSMILPSCLYCGSHHFNISVWPLQNTELDCLMVVLDFCMIFASLMKYLGFNKYLIGCVSHKKDIPLLLFM